MMPRSYYGASLAVDQTGQIYVAANTDCVDRPCSTDIFVYPPNSTGAVTPSRKIELPSRPTIDDGPLIAVGPTGLLYVFYGHESEGGQWTWPLVVYSATATGAATPLRTLQIPNGAADIAADAAGNVYVAGWVNGGDTTAIMVYPPTASGAAMPARTITLGNYGYIYGVAVDPAGDIFVSLTVGCSSSCAFGIEEFAPGASGAATPINTIDLTAASGWDITRGGPVRLDGAGNIFTFLQEGPNPGQLVGVIYGFGPTATGAQTPSLQIAPTGNAFNYLFAVN